MTRRQVLAVCLVVAVVVVAGCSDFYDAREPPGEREVVRGGGGGGSGGGGGGGGSGGGGGGGDVVRPDTPVTVAPADRVAPGVSEDRLVNVTSMLAAHRATVAERGFVAEFTHRDWETDIETDGRDWTFENAGTMRAEPGLSTYQTRIERKRTSPPETVLSYGDADGHVRRTVAGGNATVERASGPPATGVASHYMVRNVLEWGVWTVETVRDDGSVVLTTDALEAYARPSNERNVDKNASFAGRMVVSPEGVVRRLSVTYAVESVYTSGNMAGRTIGNETRTFAYEVVRLGGVSVEEPGWTEAAGNATTSARVARVLG
jgi:hypothetical protein